MIYVNEGAEDTGSRGGVWGGRGGRSGERWRTQWWAHRDRRRRRGGREARDSSGRRKTAGHGWEGRPEAEAARTRAGGLHRVGAYAQTERKRDTPRWSGRPVT